jgi:starvation-inducible DNA-binding protein
MAQGYAFGLSVACNLPIALCIYLEEELVMTTTLTSKASQRTYPTRNDLPAETRSRLTVILNQTLATTLDLKTQAKQAHWNVKGMDFLQLHELFDELSGELEEYVDLVAERITALGGTAMGTARLAAADSILPEYPFEAVDGPEHVAALADRYGIYAKHLRGSIETTANFGDADTSDLYTEISRAIDKRLWFLEAHLVNKSDIVS